MTRQARVRLFALGAGALAPLGVAALLAPLRDHVDNANVALILCAVVVAVAMTGWRPATVVGAVSAALWFDFFHTLPYESFTINSSDDALTAVVLLAVGIVVGEIAIRARTHHLEADRRADEIVRIHGVAEAVASGESPDFVVMAVANELREMLDLQDCRFEPGTEWYERKPLPRLERNGDVIWGELVWGVHDMGLPAKEVELLVQGGGQVFGRFLLGRSIGVPVSMERRVVAVALADQAGAAFAARAGGSGAAPNQPSVLEF